MISLICIPRSFVCDETFDNEGNYLHKFSLKPFIVCMCYVYFRLTCNLCVICVNVTHNSHVFLNRRRLPIVMVKLRMAQAVKDAVKYIEQGHILTH